MPKVNFCNYFILSTDSDYFLDFLHARYCRSLCFACAHFVPRPPDFVRPKIRLMNLCDKQVHFYQQVRHRQQRNQTGTPCEALPNPVPLRAETLSFRERLISRQRNQTGLTERNAPCEGKPRFSRTSDFKTVRGVTLAIFMHMWHRTRLLSYEICHNFFI